MNNPNPFLPQSAFLEQKNKARARLRIAVFFSISLSVVALMALLIQGCRKNDAGTPDNASATPAPTLSGNPPADTNTASTSNVALQPPAPVEPSNPPALPAPPPTPPEPTTSDYTVVKGDTFDTIHKKFPGVSVKAIQEANPGVDPRKLQIGQKLHIPQASATATPAPGAPEAAPGGEGQQTYKVKSGDNLSGIAKQFHTTVKAIESANNLKTTRIRVGQTLKIPAATASAPAPVGEPTLPPASTSPPALPGPAPTNQ